MVMRRYSLLLSKRELRVRVYLVVAVAVAVAEPLGMIVSSLAP
jgi:hypothetical protein